ncbi:MAG: 2-dehydropantoate 2-reductase [Halioglobus sp.]
MNAVTPRWHVLGAGAIGCLFAHALHHGKCETTLVLRQGSYPQGVAVVVERDNASSELSIPAITAQDSAHISHLLVTTKAFDVRSAVAGIAHLLDKDCVVLLLVNGMGLTEQLRNDWPQLNIYCGTTTEGAYTVSARHIRHAGRGETRVGRAGDTQPPPWFAHWSQTVERSLWDAQITRALWSKLAVNCIINPLTALHGCRNGALAQRADLREQVAALVDEVAAVSRAAGYVDIAQSLDQNVANVIAGTADNRSSMLQDIQLGRPTEIDYINGYLLQVAAGHGVDAPHNRALVERIKNRDY